MATRVQITYSPNLFGEIVAGMDKKQVINDTEDYVINELSGESSGHDWWHVYRVRNNAMEIAKSEKGADLFVVELAALLHDIADYKLHGGDTTIGPKTARKWLNSKNVEKDVTNHVVKIIEEIDFKGAGVKSVPTTLEGKIVQDADKLDAIGAIGIARTFAFGGKFGAEIYNPGVKPVLHKSFKAYKNSKGGPVINHFYEKLLLLKDRMNTKSAKRIAIARHKYMEDFLKRFYDEWDGRS